MHSFMQALDAQRWDDHRYYHHSRINQSLHLVSACSFLVSYALLLHDPAAASLLAWMLAMTSRQSGHFFFEPKGYDQINCATHEHKEEIKVGYNLRRKVVLMVVWALSPLLLIIDPSAFGTLIPHTGLASFADNVGIMWLTVGVGGLLFRTIQLFFIKDIQTGLVWMLKILTDPFHDAILYRRAPLYLMRGELVDPQHAQHEA
ncbi:MAG: hypothetical protein AB7F79_06060 [Steroidobacteraceae bacterium]